MFRFEWWTFAPVLFRNSDKLRTSSEISIYFLAFVFLEKVGLWTMLDWNLFYVLKNCLIFGYEKFLSVSETYFFQ